MTWLRRLPFLFSFLLVFALPLHVNALHPDTGGPGKTFGPDGPYDPAPKNWDVASRDPDLEPGFPVKARYEIGSFPGPAILTLVGNIDGDATLEIVANGVGKGPLYAWNSDGSLVPGWPVALEPVPAMLALGELSRERPGLEIFVAYGGRANGEEIKKYAALDGSGAVLPGWPRQPSGHLLGPPTLCDIDGDGLDEIFIWEGYSDGLAAYRADGSILPGWPVEADAGWAAPIDLERDGVKEIITIKDLSSNGGLLVAYHPDGSPQPDFSVPVNPAGGDGPAVGDVNGDGASEIIIPSYLPDGSLGVNIITSDGIVTHSTPAAGTYGVKVPALADLDGDSVPEIVLQMGAAINIWRGDGSTYPGWPVKWVSYYCQDTYTSAVVGDVDGDYQPDILAVSFCPQNYQSLAEVRVYNAKGQLHPRFPKEVNLGRGGDPAIADIDLDGRNEILVTRLFQAFYDYEEGFFDRVWAYDLGGCRHGRVEWGQRKGDPGHQGYYAPRPAVIDKVDLALDLPQVVYDHGAEIVEVPVHYDNRGSLLANAPTLTATYDSRLTFLGDTSTVEPIVQNDRVVWTQPCLEPGGSGSFIMYFKPPEDVQPGDRYSVHLELETTALDASPSDNRGETDLVVLWAEFIPQIYR